MLLLRRLRLLLLRLPLLLPRLLRRLRLRAVGDRDARERAVLASVAPARRAHGDSAILEFSGVSCAPGEPSLVAEALGANALGATFRAAIAPGPTSCRTVVHDQATVLAYVAPGV